MYTQFSWKRLLSPIQEKKYVFEFMFIFFYRTRHILIAMALFHLIVLRVISYRTFTVTP